MEAVKAPWKIYIAANGMEIVLNESLAKNMGLTEETMQKIADVHGLKKAIIEHMKIMNPENKSGLRMFADEITSYEMILQDLWGFSRDANYHRPWTLPHCTCPKMDNEERYGTGYTIITMSCPIHGE